MKIVCDSCGTKYSIADEKVRGKVFKIRCKKCSHIIVVRGGESAPEAAAPAADGGWHVVIDGEQVGPLTDADVRTKIERGEIRADTYTWKEGFADWVKLSAVPDFAGLVSGDEVAAVAAAAGGELFTGTPAHSPATNGTDRARRSSGAGASLFGEVGSGDVFAASPAAAPAGSGDLFASPSAPSGEESRWPSSGVPAAGHDGGRVENLTGQRHENSVLFSLSNLQSLAMPSAAPKPVAGTATSEGSGLIDIRAMAASTLGTSAPAAAVSGGGAPPDDLPAFGSFSPAAPVLLPLPSSSGPPKWMYAAGVLMLAALVGIGVMAYKVLSAKPPVLVETVRTVPAPAPAPVAKAAAPAAPPSTIADDKLPPREEGAEASGAPERGEHEHQHHHGKHEREHEASRDKKSERGGSASASATAAAAPAEKKPAKGSLDDLLDGAVRHPGGGRRVAEDDSSQKSAAAAGPLSKSAVVAGMNSVKPKVEACYNQYKQQGMAMVNIVIGRSGKVTSAKVTGKFSGTPTGACVERAVSSAHFPPSEGLSTPYPFMLR
jgi:predicted Zn finger-like uncharacterized protein